MGSESRAIVALTGAMLLVGAIGWWIQLRPALEVDAHLLERLPLSFGSWNGRDIPLRDIVEAKLRADANLSRSYVNRVGDVVWVYVGYYGTHRGGRPEHLPGACYPSAGWTIEDTRKVEVGAAAPEFWVNELVVSRGGERRLVHFWFRSHQRSGMVSSFGVAWDHLQSRLGGSGRADGALVRVSTPIAPDGAETARYRLLAFVTQLDPMLGAHWPDESPEGA